MKNLFHWSSNEVSQFIFENCDHLNNQVYSSREDYQRQLKTCQSSLGGLSSEVRQQKVPVSFNREKQPVVTRVAQNRPRRAPLGPGNINIRWAPPLEFNELDKTTQADLVYRLGPEMGAEIFDLGVFETEEILSNVRGVLTEIEDLITIEPETEFIGGHTKKARFAGTVLGYKVRRDEVISGAIYLNISGNDFSTKNESTRSTLLNELAHKIASQLANLYVMVARYAGEKRETTEVLDEIFEDFSHNDFPKTSSGYSFSEVDEFWSDAFTYIDDPSKVVETYVVYGSPDMLGAKSYGLSCDFLILQIESYLNQKGGDYSAEDVQEILTSIHDQYYAENPEKIIEIMEQYHLTDSDFYDYVGKKYETLSKALYAHYNDKLRGPNKTY